MIEESDESTLAVRLLLCVHIDLIIMWLFVRAN